MARLNPEARKNMRQNWISLQYEFASPVLQKFWVEGPPTPDFPHIFTYEECMNCYFGDLNLEEGLDWALQYGLLSKVEIEIISEFYHLADKYEEPSEDLYNALLKDPLWLEVRYAAQKAWLRLKEVINDQDELELIQEWEKRWGEIKPYH